MTDYHPVTKEELDMIKNDCAYPEKLYCEGCKYHGTNDEDLPCKFKGANALMDEVLERPDPLALLQKWINKPNIGGNHSTIHIIPLNEMIERIRTNPSTVRERGIKTGGYNDR